MALETLVTLEELKDLRDHWHNAAESVGFVPTMGALHEGHLSLVKQAKEACQRVIVSIFVNPTQFGANEDFATYPRSLRSDIEMLKSLDVDAVFSPQAIEIYPAGFQTFVSNSEMSKVLCGAQRPNHFQGVLTVLMKLFQLINPSMVMLGKKDYQQLRVVERMVEDFYLPTQIVGCEIVREQDGLAMSSRNRRLTEEHRRVAPTLYRALQHIQQSFQSGQRQVAALYEAGKRQLEAEKALQLQYLEIRDQKSLEAIDGFINRPAVCFVAALLGQVRLIDNIELEHP